MARVQLVDGRRFHYEQWYAGCTTRAEQERTTRRYRLLAAAGRGLFRELVMMRTVLIEDATGEPVERVERPTSLL